MNNSMEYEFCLEHATQHIGCMSYRFGGFVLFGLVLITCHSSICTIQV